MPLRKHAQLTILDDKSTLGNFPTNLFNLSAGDFDSLAIEVYHYQYENNLIYREFCDHLGKNPSTVKSPEFIPFMPIEFFRSFDVMSGAWDPEIIFTSSGTSGAETSRHLVKNLASYREISLRGFREFFGSPENLVILALLPSYLEREGSSLIDMVAMLIDKTGSSLSGFFLYEHEKLHESYLKAREEGKDVMVIGVSFALMDLAEKEYNFSEATVLETGGMKGRRKEITRAELHKILQWGLKIEHVGSEYGMTELMSQAYSTKNGIYRFPEWVRLSIREVNDPFTRCNYGKTGIINVLDLGNVHSCSFIATRDLGKLYKNGTFEVTGRLDNSDIRGCNLMIN